MVSHDPLEAAAERAAELAAAPVAPSHAWIAESFSIEVDPAAGAVDAPPDLLADARRLGLIHVGRKT